MPVLEEQYETHEFDVIVIGAGGAGLRASIAAAQAGMKTAVICKSLLGKAHTVMAEGGVAASLGNVDSEDGWKTHFSDTMKGGKGVNNWRMAEIFAKEAGDRVLELERWGAVFDRTPAGLINQRPFGAHTYRRLCHIGDRTGLEIIRSLQDKGIHSGIDVFMEYTMTRLLKDEQGRVCGAFGYRREDGRFVVFKARAVVMATGGWGKMFKVTSNSWESTGDGLCMAFEAGAELLDLEFVQFHPTGMIWPPGARGILVTEAVRGEGGRLKNSEGRRFMEDYDADRMELSSRDIVARAIYKEVEAGRGSEHGGAYLDITHRGADYIKKKLPSMHEQFLKLADVDITEGPMEVGPTIHYVMGGIRVDPESAAASIPGLFAAGEVAGGLHGANRLGGNSLSDILVFGRRAGEGAAAYAKERGALGTIDQSVVQDEKEVLLKPFANFDAGRTENPFVYMAELQAVLGDYNGISRTGEGLQTGLRKLLELKQRVEDLGVPESRMFNPGWHACRDQVFMTTIAEAMFLAGIERKESRGGHWRLDFLDLDPDWGKHNLVARLVDGEVRLEKRRGPEMPAELAALIDDKPAVSQAALQATRQ